MSFFVCQNLPLVSTKLSAVCIQDKMVFIWGGLFVCVVFLAFFLFVGWFFFFLVSASLPIEGSGSRLVLLLPPFRKQKYVT